MYETLKRKAEGTLANKLFKTPKLSEGTSTNTGAISHPPQITATSSGRAPQRGQTATMTKNHPHSPFTRPSTSDTKRRSPDTINSSKIATELHKSPSPFAIDNDNISLRNDRRSTPYSLQFSRSTSIDVDAEPFRMTPGSITVAPPKGTAGQRPSRPKPPVIIDLDSDSDDSSSKPLEFRSSVTIDLDSDGDDSSHGPTTNRSSSHVSRLRHTFATTKKEPSPALDQEATRQTIDPLKPASEPASQVSATPTTYSSNTFQHDTDQNRPSSETPSTFTTTSDTQTSSTMSVDPVAKLAEEETKKDDGAATNSAEGETNNDDNTATNSLEEDMMQEYGSETLSEDEAGSDTESDNDTDEEMEEDDEIVKMRWRLDQLHQAKRRKAQLKAQRKAEEERREAAAIEVARIEREKAEQERLAMATLTQERVDAERQDKERLERERLDMEKIMNERIITSNASRSDANEQDDEKNAWEDFTRAQELATSGKDPAHPNETPQETSQPPTESIRPNTNGNPPTPISAQRLWSSQSEPVFGQVFKYDNTTGSKIGRMSVEEAADLVRRHEGKPMSTKTAVPFVRGANALDKLRAEAQKDAERIRAQQAKPVSQDPALLEQIRQQAQQDVGNLKKGILSVNDNDSQVQASTASSRSTPEYSQSSRSATHPVEGYSPSLVTHNIFRKPTKRIRPNRPSKEWVLIPLEKVTHDDWYLIELVKQGLSWSQIHEIWEAKTGVPRHFDFYRYRYNRMHRTFPDRIPPLSGSITLKTKAQEHPVHTEKDVMAAIFATPDPSSSTGTSTARPTTGGKTITPEMARYFLARSPTPESADTSDEEEDTMLQTTKLSSPTLKQDKHTVHYTYQVERKAALGGRNPNDVPWMAQSEEMRGKKAANALAVGAIYTNYDGLDFKFDEVRGRFSKVNGLWSAEAFGEEGTIYVRVNRRLRYSQKGILIDKALPLTVYDVFEKRTITITTKEWKLKPGLELGHEHEDHNSSGKADDASGDKDLETELEEALMRQDDEEQAIPVSDDEASQHSAREAKDAPEPVDRIDSPLNNPVADDNGNDNDKDLDDLFHENNADADAQQASAETKHVHFADEPRIHLYTHPDDIPHSPEPSTNHAETETGTETETETKTANTDTEIIIDSNNYTLHTTTQKTTSTTSITPNTIYTHLHLANEAAVLRLFTLQTESASASFLVNPTIDAQDFSLNWKLPGRSAQSMDRAHHWQRVKGETEERLAQLDALEEEAVEGGGGEDAWSAAIVKEDIKGRAWSRVERWDGVCEHERDENGDRNDEEDEEEDETAVRKRVTTATEVEIWVQARKIEGPRNP